MNTDRKVIIATEREKSINYFDEIIKTIPHEQIKKITKNVNICEAEMQNGDMLYAITDNSSHGIRYCEAFVEESVSENYIQSVVLPFLTFHKDGSDPILKYFK
jgi:hypothetical protein